MSNDQVKWAAAHDLPSETVETAAPLERLVGQGSEKNMQESINKQTKSLTSRNVIGDDPIENEFYHWLYDVLVLSGVPIEIARKAKNPDTVTASDAEDVRTLACRMIDESKSRMASINMKSIKVRD